mmetsp:Transcript_19693/g.48399  ORF Transcript_19693/g.48399 Transcript_19693/m.48399 type:complete len:656 (-) Transcript_19693:275-2242(-)
MQEEEDHDDDSFVLIEKAKEHQEYGESIAISDAKDPIKCKPFLDSLILALVKRESALGRYNYETAQTYASMGKLYFHMRHPRAAVMFRASFRIEYFLYGKCTGRIAGNFKGFLLERGLSDNDTEGIRKDILFSARYEIEGDILRRFGDRRAAAMEYQKAARVEELAFGTDNPDLAFLWRKMACLASIKKTNMHIVDFEECDRLGSKWINEAKDHISSSVSAGIKKGDKYYQSLLYGKAIKEYVKATLGDRPRPIPKPRPRRNNRRNSAGAESVEQELQTMITSSNSSVQSRPPRPQSNLSGNTKSQSAPRGAGFENSAIKVTAEAVPFSATQGRGAASQDSSRRSRSLRYDETKDLDEKSEDLETAAIASSIATSDDGSWYSPEDTAKQSSSEKQRPYLGTSLYEIASKNSSRALRDTGSKKPKSESSLRYMSIKPAAQFANRALKKLRTKKKGKPKSEPLMNMREYSPPSTTAADPALDHFDSRKGGSSVDSDSNLHPPKPALHQKGMPVIEEISTPESSSSPTDDEIPSSSMRSLSERRSARSRRTVRGQSARRLSADSFSSDDMMFEKPRSRRRTKAVTEQRAQRQKQPRQRDFKKVIPTNNYQRDADNLAKVGGSENPFLVFEDPSNSSSSPSPTGPKTSGRILNSREVII